MAFFLLINLALAFRFWLTLKPFLISCDKMHSFCCPLLDHELQKCCSEFRTDRGSTKPVTYFHYMMKGLTDVTKKNNKNKIYLVKKTLQNFFFQITCKACSMPCISPCADHIWPSDWLARNKQMWSQRQSSVHDKPFQLIPQGRR